MDSLDPVVTGLREALLLPAEGRSVIFVVVGNVFGAVLDHCSFLWRALDPDVLDLLLLLHVV